MNKYSVGYNLDFREAQCVSITRVVRSAAAIILTEQVEVGLGVKFQDWPQSTRYSFIWIHIVCLVELPRFQLVLINDCGFTYKHIFVSI